MCVYWEVCAGGGKVCVEGMCFGLKWVNKETEPLTDRELKCKLGEKEIDSITAVEDTKGNNGERGETLARLREVAFVFGPTF